MDEDLVYVQKMDRAYALTERDGFSIHVNIKDELEECICDHACSCINVWAIVTASLNGIELGMETLGCIDISDDTNPATNAYLKSIINDEMIPIAVDQARRCLAGLVVEAYGLLGVPSDPECAKCGQRDDPTQVAHFCADCYNR